MHMRVWYLDCHEAGLCCFLVIHTENLLHPLQLFYFQLWPIYWLSLVTEEETRGSHIFNLTVCQPTGSLWPSCSQNLIFFDFYLWENLKQKIYRNVTYNLEALQIEIWSIILEIMEGEVISQNLCWCNKYVDVEGYLFQQLL
jgi:hypothetical protein